MAGFIQNILWNSVEGFVEAGTRTAGGYAGDALIKAGDLIEGGGRKVGGGLERTASNYGAKISGQSYQSTPKSTPNKKPAVTPKRSNSMPASTKAGSNRAKAITAASSGKPTSKVPIGGNKYPGGKGVPAIGGGAKKKITNGASGVGRGVTGGVVGGTAKKAASISGGAGGAKPSFPKPYTPSLNSTANSYTNPFPSSEKKTAVKPGGKPKPFNPSSVGGSVGGAGAGATYPGTNTPVGSGKKTPVREQQYKPLERMSGVAEKGKVQHIGGF